MSLERIIPTSMDPDDGSLREHQQRYEIAAGLLNPSDIVVDAGCGSGYGSAVLALKAAQVIGLDVSQDAIDHAAAHYKADNLTFRIEDLEAGRLPPCDVLVAFEVIEHLRKPSRFVEKAKEAASRLIFISTPVTPTMHRNQFHLHDWTQDEVEQMFGPWSIDYKLLQAGADHEVYGVWGLSPPAGESRLRLADENLEQQHVEMMRSHALITTLRDWIDEIQTGKGWLDKRIKELEEDVANRDAIIIDLKAWIDSQDTEKKDLLAHAERLSDEVDKREEVIAELRSWIDQLEKGKAWLERQLGLSPRDDESTRASE